MKNLFKISTGISEMPITQQKNTSGGFWDDYNKGGIYDYLKLKENGGGDGGSESLSSYSRS